MLLKLCINRIMGARRSYGRTRLSPRATLMLLSCLATSRVHPFNNESVASNRIRALYEEDSGIARGQRLQVAVRKMYGTNLFDVQNNDFGER